MLLQKCDYYYYYYYYKEIQNVYLRCLKRNKLKNYICKVPVMTIQTFEQKLSKLVPLAPINSGSSILFHSEIRRSH